MVLISWILTIMFSCPQAIIFRLMKHPAKEFYQCTTYNFFQDISSPVVMGNTTHLLLLGLSAVQWANIYHTIFNSVIFFIPVLIIVSSYVRIFHIMDRSVCSQNYLVYCTEISKRKFLIQYSRRSKQIVADFPDTKSLSLRQKTLSRSNNISDNNMSRKESMMKALKTSIIHVVAFVVSWTPYTFMATW